MDPTFIRYVQGVEQHRHPDRLGFLPKYFYIARGDCLRTTGSGRTPAEALASRDAKVAFWGERIAA